jgi:hypothetical protein
VKNRGGTETSGQLEHDIRTGEHVIGVDKHIQEATGRIEHLAEESEGRGQSTVRTTESSWQKDATTWEQAVKKQEAGESETPLETEREKNTVTCEAHENRVPEIEEDSNIKPSSDVR